MSKKTDAKVADLKEVTEEKKDNVIKKATDAVKKAAKSAKDKVEDVVEDAKGLVTGKFKSTEDDFDKFCAYKGKHRTTTHFSKAQKVAAAGISEEAFDELEKDFDKAAKQYPEKYDKHFGRA